MTFRDIPGWTDFYTLYDIVAEQLPDESVIVEVGSLLGRSACYLAYKIKELNKTAEIHCVDIWDTDLKSVPFLQNLIDCNAKLQNQISEMADQSTRDIFINNINECGYADMIVSHHADSIIIAQGFEKKVDFIFLDGCHDYPYVKNEILAWLPHVKDTGFIGGHDANSPGVRQAVLELTEVLCPMIYNSLFDNHPEMYFKGQSSWLLPKAFCLFVRRNK